MKHVIQNQLFLWRLCFKTCPGFMIYHLYDGFRYQGVIFIEHVLGIRYVLHCAEYHEPFWKALLVIGIILTVNLLQIIPDGFYIHGWSYRSKPKLYRALKEQMYKKASEIDLSCYDDPKYYNDFVFAVAEAENSIDRFLALTNMLVQALTILFTTGVFYLVTDAMGIVFVLASFVLRFFVSRVLNKLNYKVRLKVNPLERKRNYVSRVFYLNDYAKELRLHPVVGDSLEKEFAEANERIIDEQKKAGAKRTILGFINGYVVGDFILDGLYITYLVFQAAVLHTIDYSNAVVLFNRTGSLRRGFGNLADIFPQAQENSLYVDKIRAFLEYEPRIERNEGSKVPSGNSAISLTDVSFRYREDLPDTLKNISLNVKPGEKIAIVGYNGAGKTTLIKLLMRLYDPTEGVIRYHDRDIREYAPRDYRKHIGVVFQDYQMYGASLAENVIMSVRDGQTEESDRAIIAALERAGFGERLASLPKGLDTQVTTEFDREGVNFSGGESQKIAISRAFFMNADILIMDEPSSALDPIAEYELNRAMKLAARGKTVFYISHRLSTTRDADRILMLENGRIVEEGTHQSLLDAGGKYARMWHAQAGRYTE
ncbi:MAG: ABC transporter ATP-binding protein/permease [Lachnospiraceae bacterium]|nr:ABC transporter ATP-binding protein/permease [Lachnospiraceae bacterium]